MPEISNATEHVDELIALVDQVVAAGGTTTEEYDRILRGWRRLFTPANHVRALFDAVCADDQDAINRARMLSLVAAGPTHVDNRQIAGRVLQALLAAYRPSAAANYAAIAKSFDAKAKALSEATKLAPPSATAEAMIGQSAKAQTAWQQSALLAGELETMTPALYAAAKLAGVNVQLGNGKLVYPGQIPLVCDTKGAHRRRLYEAFDSRSHRLGRWGALLELGVTIRAMKASSLSAHVPYAEPAAIQNRLQREGTGWRNVEVDPCDFEAAGVPVPSQTKQPEPDTLALAAMGLGESKRTAARQ